MGVSGVDGELGWSCQGLGPAYVYEYCGIWEVGGHTSMVRCGAWAGGTLHDYLVSIRISSESMDD